MRLTGVAIRRFRGAENLFLPVSAGRVSVILGQNDAGKSTVLNAIATLAEPVPSEPHAVVIAYGEADEPPVLPTFAFRTDDPVELLRAVWFDDNTDFGPGDTLRDVRQPISNRARILIQEALESRTVALTFYGPGYGSQPLAPGPSLTRWLAVPPDPTLTLRDVLSRLVASDGEWLQAEWVLRRLVHLEAEADPVWWEILTSETRAADSFREAAAIRDDPAARHLFEMAPSGEALVDDLIEHGTGLVFWANRLAEPWLRESLVVPIGYDVAPIRDIVMPSTRQGDLDARIVELCDRVAATVRPARAEEPGWIGEGRSWNEVHEQGLVADAERGDGALEDAARPQRPGRSARVPWFVVRSDDPYTLERIPALERLAREIATVATSLLPRFLAGSNGDRPSVIVELGEQAEATVLLRWNDDSAVRVDQIAEGYRLWVGLAVRCAIRHVERWLDAQRPNADARDGASQDQLTEWEEPNLDGLLLLLDEPERHLHPALQRQAAAWLREFARVRGVAVVVATHAPAFLAIDDAVYYEVRKDLRRRMSLEPVDPRDLEQQRDVAVRLGYDRGELSHLYRAILLVEGTHDEIVLREWFAEELGEARVLVMPLRGTRNLGSFSWALEGLLRFIDLPVGFLLDRDESMRRAFDLADRLRDTPGFHPPDLPDPDRRLYRRYGEFINLLAYGHLSGAVGRWAHGKDDIIFFLDEELFLQRSPSYTHADAQSALATLPNVGIKPWLETQSPWKLGSGFFSDDNIRKMAREGRRSDDPTLLRVISEITAWAAASTSHRE